MVRKEASDGLHFEREIGAGRDVTGRRVSGRDGRLDQSGSVIYVGARIFDNFVVTDRGIFRACLALKALGMPSETYFESPGDVANTLIRELKAGKGLKIVVKHRKGPQDQIFANVADYLPLGEEEETDVPF